MCLVLQNSGDGVDGFATLESDGEWVFGQCDASLFFISLQGRLEEPTKTGGFCLVSHIEGEERRVVRNRWAQVASLINIRRPHVRHVMWCEQETFGTLIRSLSVPATARTLPVPSFPQPPRPASTVRVLADCWHARQNHDKPGKDMVQRLFHPSFETDKRSYPTTART